MLFQNDLFEFRDAEHRLLLTEPALNKAWVIATQDRDAWPYFVALSTISGLEAIEKPAQSGKFEMTAAAKEGLARAKNGLGDILTRMPQMFEDSERYRIIMERCKATGISRPTLYKWLRRWWQNGQTDMALIPGYGRCGVSTKGLTAGRGPVPKHGNGTYQLTFDDHQRFHDVIKSHYLSDERVTLTQTFQRLLERHYVDVDGNGDNFIRADGERPSFRQFQHFLLKNYSLEMRLRARKGDKRFALEDRAILGTVMTDCMGVGHYYEADASIGDVYLVAVDDVETIVGKPTLYFIIDRFSRLIVGFYVGLENASWIVAMQAILSISQDKRELCERYGVEYDKDDWPAHMVFPKQILADLGEWNSRGGMQFSKAMATTVAFTPSQRADWKPVVESNFKQTRMTLQDGTPGFDPPENAKRRQGKHYEQDACLTLHDFTAKIIHLVIAHNRAPLKDFVLSTEDFRTGFLPTPRNIWNRDIGTRSGLLHRYTEKHVRLELLARDEATVTEHGVEFKGCTYVSRDLIAKGWFVRARSARFKVGVSFDHRSVRNIFVHDPNGAAEPFLCELSERSKIHVKRCFAEVKVYEDQEAKHAFLIEQARIQGRADYHAATDPIDAAATERLKAVGRRVSRSARKADTKPARERELSNERQITGSLVPSTPKNVPTPSAPVLDFKSHKRAAEQQEAAPAVSQPTPATAIKPPGVDLKELARLAREKLKQHG